MRWALVDKILECSPGVSATGTKTFPRSDLFFMDHFPEFPIVPGVLQIEMMAQLAGKCISLKHPGILPVLGSVKQAKFYANVGPGDLCIITAKISKIAKAYSVADMEVKVDGVRVSAATILFGHVSRDKMQKNSEHTEFDAVTRDFLRRQK
jgi:3-hydroxyacyl-[acyl-carrier-protein] dehydratase